MKMLTAQIIAVVISGYLAVAGFSARRVPESAKSGVSKNQLSAVYLAPATFGAKTVILPTITGPSPDFGLIGGTHLMTATPFGPSSACGAVWVKNFIGSPSLQAHYSEFHDGTAEFYIAGAVYRGPAGGPLSLVSQLQGSGWPGSVTVN